jgi:UDP-glucose 4-epimerase
VFASSAAVYGEVATMPVDEDTPTRPVSPYGIDKLASEHALDYYAAVHGVPATSLRFFNVYGPRQDPSSPYSGVISIFATRARAGQPLTVYGDGGQTRDFVYVGDVVRAIAAALGDGASRVVANVGTGGEITVLELARTIIDLCSGGSAIDERTESGGTHRPAGGDPHPAINGEGRSASIEHAPARAGEILKSRARVDRLREALGVVAETRLVDGLRETLR